MSRSLTSRVVWTAILTGFIGLALLPCLVGVGIYQAVYSRHQQAYQRWQARQPQHYRYLIRTDKLLITRRWLVEVRQGKVVRMEEQEVELIPGMLPWSQATSLAPLVFTEQSNLIEEVFKQIAKGMKPASSPNEFLARVDPMFYLELSQNPIFKGGWDACRPQFPKVSYHPLYSYPQEVVLYGLPCVSSIDKASAIGVKIEVFETLP